MLERFVEFTYLVFDIQRRWNKIASDGMFGGYGLKGFYLVYLISVYRSADGITAAELASLCGRDKADVSRAVADLQAKGLIEKTEQYRAKLRLTDYGKKITAEIVEKTAAAESAAGEGISDGERQALYSALAKIRDNLRELERTGIQLPEKSGSDMEGEAL